MDETGFGTLRNPSDCSVPYSLGRLSWVHGVDFSGAENAGTKIWIASGVIEEDVLRIEDCRPAEALPGSDRDRDRCLAALWDFIGKQQVCAFGLDFPFGLPQVLIKEDSWEDFVLSFRDRCFSPKEFREACRTAAGGSELKRVTDRERQTPFSPYNLRLYRQTYFGIRDVLGPLVRKHLAYVLPMQSALLDKPWVFEVCPASTLKQESLYLRYKGRSKEKQVARARVLKGIEEKGALLISAALRATVLGDPHGDALDSVVAAFATFRALRNPVCLAIERNDAYALEGYVYV